MLARADHRNRALGSAARLAASAAGYIASKALNGAVTGLGKRAQSTSMRYFRGDVSQPNTSHTAQQVAPSRRMHRQTAKGGASVVEHGTLKLADVTTPAGTASGHAIASYPLKLEFMGGRLYGLSTLYSRWRFLSAILRFVPAVSSATDGSMVVYYSQEPDDTYNVGEVVGAGNAVASIDNMEFSVREKMNMQLHLPGQMLYTTPGTGEPSWHSAGVVNVVDNGALTAGKTYGSLYMDYVVSFTQPCAPFDVYAPIVTRTLFSPSGAAAVGSGPAAPLFVWSLDVPKLDSSSGSAWFQNPSTGQLDTSGKLWLPPYTSLSICIRIVDSAGTTGTVSLVSQPGITVISSSSDDIESHTVKLSRFFLTNSSAAAVSTQLVYTGTGANLNNCWLDINRLIFTPA